MQFPKAMDAGSPLRPAVNRFSPMWIRPLRNVPVVRTTTPDATRRPSRSSIPATRPATKRTSVTSACLIKRFGVRSRIRRMTYRYPALSAWARGDHTAGPRLVLSSRNCIPASSAATPMTPPSASISRTRWPFAIPPMAGLHDICAMRSAFIVYNAVFKPICAAACAASHPACPAPTTTTSKFSSNIIIFRYRKWRRSDPECPPLQLLRSIHLMTTMLRTNPARPSRAEFAALKP